MIFHSTKFFHCHVVDNVGRLLNRLPTALLANFLAHPRTTRGCRWPSAPPSSHHILLGAEERRARPARAGDRASDRARRAEAAIFVADDLVGATLPFLDDDDIYPALLLAYQPHDRA